MEARELHSRVIGRGVRLARLPDGIELYFPPLRAPGAALSLALFGVACLIPGVFAAVAVVPLSASGAAGMLAIWLMASFIVPFIVFGVLFLAVAAYRLANSLTVVVTSTHALTVRRVLGIAVRKRHVAHADICALEAIPTRRYRWLRDRLALYDLVVRTRTGGGHAVQAALCAGQSRQQDITVAEGLQGEELMETIRAEIATAARLDQPA